MGTRMAPSNANLFIGKFEQQAIENAPYKPFVWWRFIDDIFVVWTEGIEHLRTFINYLQLIHVTRERKPPHVIRVFTEITIWILTQSLLYRTVFVDYLYLVRLERKKDNKQSERK